MLATDSMKKRKGNFRGKCLNPYVVAVREWQERPETVKRMTAPGAEGVYLRNRLLLSFEDGWKACEAHFERLLNEAVRKVRL